MIPCIDCLMIPICRQKSFVRLTYDCSTIRYHLYYKSEHELSRIEYRKATFNYNIIELDYLFNTGYREALLNHYERLKANKKYLKRNRK